MLTTGYDNRILVVEVTGWSQPGVMQTSPYRFTVPYRSLTRTLRFIRCTGGKINQITVLSPPLHGAGLETENMEPLIVPMKVENPLIEPTQPPTDSVSAAQLRAHPETPEPSQGSIDRLISMFKKITRQRSDD